MTIRTSFRKTALAVLAAALAASVVIPGSAGAGAPRGRITVVHAIPDLIVDVYADDALVLEDFEPGTITDPLRLAAGTYDVEITPANSSTVALAATVKVKGKTDAAAVAYLDADGDPTLGLFANKQKAIRKHRARVTVRHTAAAPKVDVRYKRRGGEWKYLTKRLMNGEQARRGFKSGTYRLDVVLAGTRDRVLGPVTLELERRTHYFAYAWGSASGDSLALNLSTRRLQVR